MAHEITPWKQTDCALSLKIDMLSRRETFSREINKECGGGGGLNANYRTVEAVAMAASELGHIGLFYGVDFVFKTAGTHEFSLDFRNPSSMERARRAIENQKPGATR